MRGRVGLVAVLLPITVSCGALAPEYISEGPCTLALIRDGERLSPPYSVPMGRPSEGLPDVVFRYEAAGWRGTVRMVITLPGGETHRSSVDAASFNGEAGSQGFEEPGLFHFSFHDGTCRHEFDVEVVRP